MSARRSPTMRRQRLGVELRRLRESTGLTIEQVAHLLECSHSKVSRIETGRVSPTPRDVRDMLRLYGIRGQHRDVLIEMARETRKAGWWHRYRDVPAVPAYIGLEAAAGAIRTYGALVVPGLLQTMEYARALLRAVRPDLSVEETERRVELRMARQELLNQEDPPALWVVLDEAALRRPVGGHEVMQAQLRRLGDVATLPSVTFQVVPFGIGEHAGLDGQFIVFRFSERAEPDIVYLDNIPGDQYLDRDEEVQRYALLFERLSGAALKPTASARFIASLLDDT
jgi:transcriptional regulator with XRE-family HTH domain